MKINSKSYPLFLTFIFSLIFIPHLALDKALGEENREERSFKVYLPQDYAERRESTTWPLVVLLHGFRASGYLQNMYLGLSKHVSSEQFILLVPDGTKNRDGNRFWNATPACCDNDRSGVDDVKFLKELILKTQDQYSINRQKVFVFGHSNGAFMAARLACEIPELLHGIITLAGTGFFHEEMCLFSHPMNVLHIHGTSDKSVLYEGKVGSYPGAEDFVRSFVRKNDCNENQVEKRKADLAMGGRIETDISEWNDCRDERRVSLFKMNGIGHLPLFRSSFLQEVFKFMRK